MLDRFFRSMGPRWPFIVIFLVALLALQGCDARRQAAADAVEGIKVLRDEHPASVRHPIADAAAKLAASAAGTTVDKLPAPTISAGQIPDRLQEYVTIADKSASSVGFWLAVGGWSIAAVSVIAGAVRMSGMGGPIVNIAATILESATAKKEREREKSLAGAATVMIGVIEDQNAGPIKKAVSKMVSPSEDAAIKESLAKKVKG